MSLLIKVGLVTWILRIGQLWANDSSLAEKLQSDEYWKSRPTEAVASLNLFFHQNSDKAIPILIKRFDGWSETQNYRLNLSAARPEEGPSLHPLIQKLKTHQIKKLYELLATDTFDLTLMQSLRLNQSVLTLYGGVSEARDKHIRAFFKNNRFSNRQIRRFEEALSDYPVSSELATDLMKVSTWQSTPSEAVRGLEKLLEIRPTSGVRILLEHFCKYVDSNAHEATRVTSAQAYSFVSYVEKFTRREVETVFKFIADQDFHLSEKQRELLHGTLAAQYHQPSAFVNHADEFLKRLPHASAGARAKSKFRLEHQLGIALPPPQTHPAR